jgi:N6-adenosine-specific RNA methylase IME4
MRAHRLASLLPDLPAEDFAALKADIAANGLLHPITVFEDKVLDGRHRERACRELGIRPKFAAYKGRDARRFVVSMNIMRRHLSASQRAMVLVELGVLPRGHRPKDSADMTQRQMTRFGHVGLNTVKAAHMVHTHGTAELQDAVREDRVPAKVAAKATAFSSREQDRIAKADDPATELRRIQRAAMERKMGDPGKMPPGKFRVILADVAWRFELWDQMSGGGHAADNHYPTMTLDQIKALKLPAADSAVLFLWATGAMMPQALEVMAAWGFAYKSQIVWAKPRAGTGYWVRSKHELLLIGTRGDIPAPAPGDQPASIIEAPLGRHSEKPEVFYEIIEKMFPTWRKLELFARRKRPGWEVWGNEV